MMKNKWILALVAVIVLLAVAVIWATQRPQGLVQASVVGLGPVDAGQTAGFARADGPRPLLFPADYGPHPDFQTEWWYYTGNLEAANGDHFGYQFTIFRRAMTPPDERQARGSLWGADQVYMAHFALSDVERQDFYAFERFSRGAVGLAGAQAEPYRVWLEDWRVEEVEPGVTRLQAAVDRVALDLLLADTKGPILQGDQGYSRKGAEPGNASYYYSLTRLESEGTVTVDGRVFAVSGFSWKDHEFSTSALSADQVGWDWFALQLDDGSELMVAQLRNLDGSVDIADGILVEADGSTRALPEGSFVIDVTDNWRSPHSGARYPAGWSLNIPSLDLQLAVAPYMADQELNVSTVYWEGAVRAEGRRGGQPVAGSGYVELTGYAQSMQSRF